MAVAGWSRGSGYNLGQILYRLAEMAQTLGLNCRRAQDAEQEVSASIDRLVLFAGWRVKCQAVLGSVNHVALLQENFAMTEPLGLIVGNEASLLALVSLVVLAMANAYTVVALVSSTHPCPAILLGEMLATSDLPDGGVNWLFGGWSGFGARLISRRGGIRLVCESLAQRASAILRPSNAALTMPPAYPAPSPQGKSRATWGCCKVSSSRGMRTGELVRVSNPRSSPSWPV